MEETKTLSFDVHLDQPYDQAIDTLAAALKEESFGVLTRVDVHATLKEKLGAEFREYSILGVCNPRLAHRALSHKSEAGLMLPCNVTVEADPSGGSIIRIADPDAFMKSSGFDQDPLLSEVGTEARARLMRVAEKLRSL